MQAIISRIEDELEDLNIKIGKLDIFLNNDLTLDRVGPYHFDLLMAQKHSMQEYRKILVMRLTDLEASIL